jgi:heme-degrading monooxygenase HmoA
VEGVPGFVCGKDSVPIDPAEDVVVNLTVWKSREAMCEFTCRAEHREFLRRRREWFRPQTQASTVLWWIPAGHLPTPPAETQPAAP